MKVKTVFGVGLCLYCLALAAIFLPPILYMTRTPVTIAGADGHINPATIWQGAEPKAVMLIGHGVTANQGVMAMLAKAFARNDYAAVAFDFWGHGHSRNRFDWSANPAQIFNVFEWARREYPGLPIAYLGYSMGGFAGAEAFYDKPVADAFVSLGALPRRVPDCKTAVAAGIFEELFTIEHARKTLGDTADVISSPFSNHATEASDPVLIARIIAWVNRALGFEHSVTFPWILWAMSLSAVALGCAGALLLATAFTARVSGAAVPASPCTSERRWSINPYRIAGMALGARGVSSPPRSGPLPAAVLRGIVFSGAGVFLLALLLDVHIFTVSMFHPTRLLTWLILTLVFSVPVWFDAWVLERVPLKNTCARFAVAALTRCMPLLVFALGLRLIFPGLAFGSMILGIYAFILVMLALVHALATRAAADWRAGATAVVVAGAWVTAFWFPLYWPWV